MAEELLDDAVAPHTRLYRDTTTGLAYAKDGSTGLLYTAHPNIDASGSVKGMVDRGHWSGDDVTITVNGYIYNISHLIVHDAVDRIVADNCQCGGNHG